MNARFGLIRSAAVVRVRIWLATAFALGALIATLLHAQVSGEEKRKRDDSLTTRQEAQADESPSPTAKPKSKKAKAHKNPSPTPRKSPSPKPKAKKHKVSADDDESTPKPKAKTAKADEADSASSTDSEKATPKPKKSISKKEVTPGKKKATAKSKGTPKKDDEGEKAPKAVRAESPRPSETPAARSTVPAPHAASVPTAAAVPPPISTSAADAKAEEPAQLTIEKTGYEKRPGFWSRVFGGSGGHSSGGEGYRYLTRSVRAEIDRAPADRRNPPWQFIVVHNSGTRQGNARVFDYYHRHVRHMQNGLAYHFVIGNGTSTGNGQIEIGDRWRRQINGGHVHSDYLNNIALGICLVGDFNRDQPTRAQLESCEELIRYLRQRCGKIGNHYAIVKPHREMNPPRWATDCPGDAFPYSWFRRFQE